MAVMGKMPVKSISFQSFVASGLEQTGQRQPVDRLVLWQRDTDRRRDRRQHVNAGYRLTRLGTASDLARPAYQEGHANPSFIGIAFTRAKWRIVGRPQQPSIVRRKNDQCTFGQACFPQRLFDHADRIIDAFHHRRVSRLHRLLALPGVFRGHFLNGLDGRVHGVGTVGQKERACGVRTDELLGCKTFTMGEVLTFAARLELLVKVVARMGIRIKIRRRLPDIATGDIDIKALGRRVPVRIAQMPFTNVGRRVAGGFQDLGNRDLLVLHPEGVGRAEQLAIAASHVGGRVLRRRLAARPLEPCPNPVRHADPRWPAARHDRRARGTANRTGRVGISKPHPLPGQPVNVWGTKVIAPLTREIHPTQVIDQDKHDVHGLGRLQAEPKGKQNKKIKDKFHGINEGKFQQKRSSVQHQCPFFV